METKEINIAEILKDCPKGTKLWCDFLGEVEFKEISDKLIWVENMCGDYIWSFNFDGSYSKGDVATCMLFPAKDKHDWSKFVNPVQTPFDIKRGKGLWYVDLYGVKREDCDMGGDKQKLLWQAGNYFNSLEQAEYAAGKVKELLLSMRKEVSNE